MRILVTGGAGFICGHLAEEFARDGHDVVAFDNFEPYYDLGIKEHNVEQGRVAADEIDGRYELVRGDVRDEEAVSEYVAGADVVFHQAAQAGVRTSVEQPQKVSDINVNGTLNVLEAARNSDTERVVVASSSSVYGKPEYLPYDEAHPTTPVSPYGASKLAQEQYTRVYNEIYSLPTVSLRYFTVYGPRMRPNMAISNFVSRCMNDEPPIIYGDGTQTRDFKEERPEQEFFFERPMHLFRIARAQNAISSKVRVQFLSERHSDVDIAEDAESLVLQRRNRLLDDVREVAGRGSVDSIGHVRRYHTIL